MQVTYAIQHPGMSMAALVDADDRRMQGGLIAQVSMHIMREFDVALPPSEFRCVRVEDPDEFIDLFEGER